MKLHRRDSKQLVNHYGSDTKILDQDLFRAEKIKCRHKDVETCISKKQPIGNFTIGCLDLSSYFSKTAANNSKLARSVTSKQWRDVTVPKTKFLCYIHILKLHKIYKVLTISVLLPLKVRLHYKHISCVKDNDTNIDNINNCSLKVTSSTTIGV